MQFCIMLIDGKASNPKDPEGSEDAGYLLIKEHVSCLSADTLLSSLATVQQCATLCYKHEGCSFFTHGTGARHGQCSFEDTKNPNCPEGWKKDSYHDFYMVLENNKGEIWKCSEDYEDICKSAGMILDDKAIDNICGYDDCKPSQCCTLSHSMQFGNNECVESEIDISFVLISRNDGYGKKQGKNVDHSFQIMMFENCIEQLLFASWEEDFIIEIIIVSWNTLTDRPELKDLINIPNHAKFDVHFVDVPDHFHKIYESMSGHIPVLEYQAKNVGVRRAKGEWIVVMNPDIMLPGELMEFMESDLKDPMKFYSIERKDIPHEEQHFPTQYLAEKCQFHEYPLGDQSEAIHAGEFLMMKCSLWHKTFAFARAPFNYLMGEEYVMRLGYYWDIPGVLISGCVYFHHRHAVGAHQAHGQMNGWEWQTEYPMKKKDAHINTALINNEWGYVSKDFKVFTLKGSLNRDST